MSLCILILTLLLCCIFLCIVCRPCNVCSCLCVLRHVPCPSPCSVSLAIFRVPHHVPCPSPCSVSLAMLRVPHHVPCPSPCSVSLTMFRVPRHVPCPSPCSVSLAMFRVPRHVPCPSPCSLSLAMLHQHSFTCRILSTRWDSEIIKDNLSEIKTKSVKTQLHSIYYTEKHVSTILGHLQFKIFVYSKHIEEGIKAHCD
jgi:hypothetical protein